MYLTPHFTLQEFIKSDTANAKGIDNEPSPSNVSNLIRVATTLEEVRSLLGNNPILISSGYRCPKLNKEVGGVPTSYHVKGLAVDFTCPKFGTVKEIVEKISSSGIGFDQLIEENGRYSSWVHLGLQEREQEYRKEVLIYKDGKYIVKE